MMSPLVAMAFASSLMSGKAPSLESLGPLWTPTPREPVDPEAAARGIAKAQAKRERKALRLSRGAA